MQGLVGFIGAELLVVLEKPVTNLICSLCYTGHWGIVGNNYINHSLKGGGYVESCNKSINVISH